MPLRVFVAGATGAIGRPLVQQLLAAGHEVTAMTRSDERAEKLRAAGVDAVVADAFDEGGVRTAVMNAHPEVVVHQLTSIPPNLDVRKAIDQLETNDRLRREGTRNLVAAAVAAGARRMVAQSVAFAYAPRGPWVLDETAPLYIDGPPPLDRVVGAVHDLEEAVTGTPGLDGVVLRYGFFYGPGTQFATDGYMVDQIRRRRVPIVGNGAGTFSFIHVDDAAVATAAALTQGVPGIYNVTDDEPAAVREWLPFLAKTLGAKRPFRVPKLLGRLGGGRYAVFGMTELRGASNAKAKREIEWAPRRATWRQGFPEVL
jgi:nucleoside-diphosphate-sugar epimerase